MNEKEYTELRNKYDYTLANLNTGDHVTSDGWSTLQRHLAFLEFDAALEEYDENSKAQWNGGEELYGVSVNDVECILDDFIARTEDIFCRIGTEEMRNAIQAVTGLIC